uniref:RING finger and transmembrane domain-containing protein 2 isoform X9 n=1 Tax=Nyctereutes procyonoides TaxID=34880 RepID=UPI002443820F|nr:RING finger and transmembrane domain-containing protein 2 isoform X9 [Nyctereutes procyonoides]
MWLLTVNQHQHLFTTHFTAACHMRTFSASWPQHPHPPDGVLRKMQRRHSSNTDNGPPESGHRGSSLLQHVGGDHRAHSDEGGDEQPGTPAPALSELKAVVCWLQKGLPFILILLAKVCFQHKLGIAVCIGMASTFAYANSTLREQVSLKEKRSVLVILWILAFLAGNTLYVLYTFSSQQLYNSLIFLKPNLETLDFFDLLWIVGIADFVLKYVTIALKCLIVALPKIILAVKSKGKFYLVIEELSQLFRSLVPIQLWYKYIMGDDSSNSYFLGGVLIVLYSLCKSFDICGRVGGVRKALKLLCTSQNYGVRATGQQCTEAGDTCAICQAEFREPLILMCQGSVASFKLCYYGNGCDVTIPLAWIIKSEGEAEGKGAGWMWLLCSPCLEEEPKRSNRSFCDWFLSERSPCLQMPSKRHKKLELEIY